MDGFHSGRAGFTVGQTESLEKYVIAVADGPELAPTLLLLPWAPEIIVEQGPESHGHERYGGLCVTNTGL